MNIFVLDEDITLAAQSHVDKHVVKMPLETAQLLCTARQVCGESTGTVPYKKTHTHHPCTKWAYASKSNYIWLCKLGLEICKEYTYRYNKIHKCEDIIINCISNTPNICDVGLTTFALAMDEECKIDNPILSYRNYYNMKKTHLFNWTKRKAPIWIIQ